MRTAAVKTLGSPSLTVLGSAVALPTRKTLALLAVLAVEPHPHARERLIELLWPDLDVERGRAALRKALTHLRSAGRGLDQELLLVERDTVRLNTEPVEVDFARLSFAGRAARADRATVGELADVVGLCQGPFLDGLVLPDAPDFDDWAAAHRAAAQEDLVHVLARLSALHLADGRLELALEAAETHWSLDPLDESAVRSVMQVRLLRADRAGALAAFEQLRMSIRREFGVEPHPDTVMLAREIEKHTAPSPVAHTALSAVALHPPQLVGRTGEWMELEEAHTAGHAAVLTGEAGIGKTRLARAFLETRGPYLSVEGRPGDHDVPLATVTRALRWLLTTDPQLSLPHWVKAELSRLMPDVITLPSAHPPAQVKFRLFEAVREALRAAASPYPALLVDDLQFADSFSQEALVYALQDRAAPGEPNHQWPLVIYREGGLTAHTREALQRLTANGEVRLLKLRPLSSDDVRELVRAVTAPHLAEDTHDPSIFQYTGGNPLMVLETLRHLQQTGGEVLPDRHPRRAAHLIELRLERLGTTARSAAHAAVVVGEQFDAHVASRMLGLPLADAAAALAELRDAQILLDGRFTFDLLHEVIRDQLPPDERQALHARALAVLSDRGAPPAVLARHALEANLPIPAFHHALEAGRVAVHQLLAMRPGLEHLERAWKLLGPAGELGGTTASPQDVEQLFCSMATACEHLDDVEGARRATGAMRTYGQRTLQSRVEVHAHFHEAKVALYAGPDLPEAQRALERALKLATMRRDVHHEMNAHYLLADAYGWAHDYPAMLRHARTAYDLATRQGNDGMAVEALFKVAEAQLGHASWNEAYADAESALERRVALNGNAANPQQIITVARARLNAGFSAHGVAAAEEAARRSRESGSPRNIAVSAAVLSQALLEVGEVNSAVAAAQEAVSAADDLPNALVRGRALLSLAVARAATGDAAGAGQLLDELVRIDVAFPFRPFGALIADLRCTLAARSGQWAAARAAALAAVRAPRHVYYEPIWAGRWWQVEALVRGGEPQLAQEQLAALEATMNGSARHGFTLLLALAGFDRGAQRRAASFEHAGRALELAREQGLVPPAAMIPRYA